MNQRFKGQNALILTWDGFQDQEVIYPYHRLLSEGFNVTIAAGPATNGTVTGIFGTKFDSVSVLRCLLDKDYDLVILPGGVKALEKVRQVPEVITFLKIYKGVIGSICHGAQLLIEADLVYGREVGGYYSIRKDIENADGFFRDGVTICENLVTTPHYKFMGEWMEEVLDELQRQSNS